MDHDTLGSRCFQKGDHLSALEHFNKAIECSSPKLVPALLNKRSLVYIKLEKFPQALRDGREIIKRVPDIAMGYLRCGQIVQLMGQRDKALGILERGLHKVSVGSDDRKILSKHYEALRKQSQATNRLDPLPRLPQEIVQHIWGLLDLKSRGRCLSVSTGWKKSMESYPPLWQDLKISNKMSETALTAWLKRAENSGYNLRSATIISHDYNEKCRNHIKRVQRRNKLERLELHIASEAASIPAMLPVPSQYLKTLVVMSGSWVDISAVKRIMAHYTHLEHVEFHALTERDGTSSWPEMPNLQSIVLQPSLFLSSVRPMPSALGLACNDLVKASPNMKSATIKDWSYEAVPGGVVDMSRWTKLMYLDICCARFASMPLFPSTLTHLEAVDVSISSHRFDTDQEVVFPLSKLEYLNVEGSELFAVVNDMASPALTSGSLKTLKVGCVRGFTRANGRNDWTQTLPAPSAALETLSLYEHIELPEKTMIAVLRQFPNLKEVDLSRTGATGSTLRELFEREIKPKFVNMKNCESCYHDAVEAAREAGIEVWHELAPKNNKTERRVRDQY